MPKTRLPYAPEFRRQMIELVRAGRDPEDLAREFEPTSQSIRNWVAQADRSEGRREEKVEPTSQRGPRGADQAPPRGAPTPAGARHTLKPARIAIRLWRRNGWHL